MRRRIFTCAIIFVASAACQVAPQTPTEPEEKQEAPARESEGAKEEAKAQQRSFAGPITLEAADGVTVHAISHQSGADPKAPMILLFHQAGSNAGEYDTIAPRLHKLGYDTLALDQRSGGDRFGRKNETVAGVPESTSYLEAYPDLEAALAWAKGEGYAKIAAWGSSYSAALVFKLGSEHGEELTAILSFSPGEYIKGQDGVVSEWASKVTIPNYVTSAAGDEVAVAKKIQDASPAKDKAHLDPEKGVHGSSTLREDANPEGTEQNWTAVEAFLKAHLSP